MTNAEILHLDEQYILPTYGRFGPCLVEGKGCRAKDADGKEYLDFGSGIGVNSLGWCDEEWAAAVSAQAGRLQHASNYFCTQPGAELAQTLCRRTGMAKVFFANSGAEANEGALKAARKYSLQKYGPGRSTILSIQNSFHGRTLGSLTATGQTALQKDFVPLPPGFLYLPANDIDALEKALTNEVCALMIEPIQGEGGVLPFEPGYIQAAQRLCQERDVLLIADEVQTGMGRTGTLLASQLIGLSPDIVTLAKGLGGGLPIGAILFAENAAQNSLAKGDHGTTFGMNPVVCAGANVVMKRLSDEFLQEIAQTGEWLKARLEALPHVYDVSGAGLMWGFSVEEPATAAALREAAQEKGLLCLPAKSRLRLLPPLIIRRDELAEGLGILQEVLESLY